MLASDFSFGIIAVYLSGDKYQFLLIQHNNTTKHWAFPKGHKEWGEEDLAVAKREFEEETGIASNLLEIESWWSQKTHYRFFAPRLDKKITKEVYYFLWYLKKKYPVHVQKKEVLSYCWLEYYDALAKLSYSTDKELLQSVAQFLKII